MKRLILSALGIAILIVGISAAMPVQTRPQPASAQQASDKYDGDCTGQETAGRCADKPFDHSNCQYPDRTTNPPNGCDNTDPACPETVKGGSGDCTPVQPVNVTPAQPQAAQCGGK